jgi:hypothetical protein
VPSAWFDPSLNSPIPPKTNHPPLPHPKVAGYEQRNFGWIFSGNSLPAIITKRGLIDVERAAVFS